MIKDFLEAMKTESEYGYISNHAHEFSKDTIVNILKEYIYGVHQSPNSRQILEGIAEEIESMYDEDE